MSTPSIKIGDVVFREDGVQFQILHFGETLGTFRALNMGTREIEELKVDQLLPDARKGRALAVKPDLEDLDKPTIDELKEWQRAIEEFNASPRRTREQAQQCAAKLGISFQHFYRVRMAYDGSLRSLYRPAPNGGREKSRLAPEVEDILKRCIDRIYVCPDAKTRELVIEAVHARCDKKRIPRVSVSTIYRRMSKTSLKKLATGKYGASEAHNQHGPAPGKYAEAIAPLRVVQIDHTPLDLQLVDEQGGEIGRAWLTVALDVYSRMVLAIYLSFEDPNTGSVGVCIHRAAVAKEDYLKRLGVKAEWPVWGLMRTIHADNGPDFRTAELKLACAEHQMDLQWRPCARPNYGAHIERLAKRINDEVKKLHGRIPADFKQRKHERPDKNGIYSREDVERRIVTWITKVYHHEFHEAVQMSPIQKFREGLLSGPRPIGVPRHPSDPTRLLLDLTPSRMRTIQRQGIEIDNMLYYDHLLDRYINARDPNNPKKARKFRCRTPLDDARVIYFQDPDTKQYHEIKCADRSMPAIDRHELRRLTKCLKQKGLKQIDTRKIKEGYRDLQKIDKTVLEKRSKSSAARSVRRQHAIKAGLQQSSTPMPHNAATRQAEPASPEPLEFKDEEIPIFKED